MSNNSVGWLFIRARGLSRQGSRIQISSTPPTVYKSYFLKNLSNFTINILILSSAVVQLVDSLLEHATYLARSHVIKSSSLRQQCINVYFQIKSNSAFLIRTTTSVSSSSVGWLFIRLFIYKNAVCLARVHVFKLHPLRQQCIKVTFRWF